jgi:hypothetical protein
MARDYVKTYRQLLMKRSANGEEYRSSPVFNPVKVQPKNKRAVRTGDRVFNQEVGWGKGSERQ